MCSILVLSKPLLIVLPHALCVRCCRLSDDVGGFLFSAWRGELLRGGGEGLAPLRRVLGSPVRAERDPHGIHDRTQTR